MYPPRCLGPLQIWKSSWPTLHPSTKFRDPADKPTNKKSWTENISLEVKIMKFCHFIHSLLLCSRQCWFKHLASLGNTWLYVLLRIIDTHFSVLALKAFGTKYSFCSEALLVRHIMFAGFHHCIGLENFFRKLFLHSKTLRVTALWKKRKRKG